METENPKTFLPHFSAADIKSIAYITTWIEQRKYTQAQLARLARVGASALNQILKGSYATAPGKILMAVESAIRRVDETDSQSIGVVETGVFKLAQAACTQARSYRNFAVLSAYVGLGKTFAIKHYANKNPNTYLIEAMPLMTVNSLVKLLARTVLGCEVKGSLEDKFQAIIDALRNTDSLIIIDEAETLTPKQLHTIRRLRDIAGIGIVLSGTEHLRGILKPEHGQFDQIRSRIGFFPETIKAITQDDAAALIQASFMSEEIADEVIEKMYKYSKGSARMLVEGLIAGMRSFRSGKPLDIKLVNAVAKQALCLQPVA